MGVDRARSGGAQSGEEIIQQGPMRALDAIHIASALVFQTAAGLGIPIVTGDGRQRRRANEPRGDLDRLIETPGVESRVHRLP
jgi:hypothetical protein